MLKIAWLRLARMGRLLGVPALLLFGSAWAASPCGGAQQKLDLVKWKLAVKGARTGPTLTTALNSGGFLRDANDQPIGQEKLKGLRKVESVLVDDFEAHLSGATSPERVIQVVVRGLLPSGGDDSAPSHYRLRVARALLPGEHNGWCDLGVVVAEEDVIEPTCEDFPGTTFAFEHLLAPDRQVISTTRNESTCSPGGRDQGTKRSVAYLALVDGQLVAIFQQVVALDSYNVMSGVRKETATITLSDGFPKTLNVESTRLCKPGMASTNFCVVGGEAGPGGDATSEWSKASLAFNGSRYAEKHMEMKRETSKEAP